MLSDRQTRAQTNECALMLKEIPEGFSWVNLEVSSTPVSCEYFKHRDGELLPGKMG